MCNPNPDILIVEDHPVQQFLFQHLAKSIGFNATIVEDPVVALALLAERDFCLILMDWQLPNLTGAECAQKIRKFESEAKKTPVPIICTSALAMGNDRERCIEAGMNDYLLKPFSIEQLRQMIELWLHRAPV